MTKPSIEEILAPLDAYYASIPLEFSIGLQNFQSIRQYTKIPLAPITLIYGQNSAGKSTIHDAFIFIHEYLGGKTDGQEYLNRWACRNRINRPLYKGYIGKPEDVVVSVKAWDTSPSAYLDYHNQYQPDSNPEFLPCGTLWWNQQSANEPTRFELLFHFSNNGQKWHIREFYLYLGDKSFLQYENNDFDEETARISLNRNHPAYLALGKLYGESIDEMALISDGYAWEVEIDTHWLHLKNLDLRDSWTYNNKTPFYWNELYINTWFNNSEYNSTKKMRELLEAMLIIPSFIASRFLKLESVPPLRPIPSKNDACFRLSSQEQASVINNNNKYDNWRQLACDIRNQNFLYLLEKFKFRADQIQQNESSSLIDHVNHVLQHPLFLNTGYEIIGDCHFLLSAKKIGEMQKRYENSIFAIKFPDFDSEVTLRLRYVPDNFTIEIEDVGVGISQIIPVLCALYNSHATYIHQPELHLHPKLQSHLGDIFISAINRILIRKSSEIQELTWTEAYAHKLASETVTWMDGHGCMNGHFFIETHSEHILLRILRRIRETNRSDIKNKLFGFTVDQLCVLYVDKDENGDSQVIQLRVADNGEFIDRWPHGFFTERDEDLFDE